MDRSEKVRLMYSLPNGMTKDKKGQQTPAESVFSPSRQEMDDFIRSENSEGKL